MNLRKRTNGRMKRIERMKNTREHERTGQERRGKQRIKQLMKLK
jgi:hypothetical protein